MKYTIFVIRNYIHGASIEVEAATEYEAKTKALERMNSVCLRILEAVEGSDSNEDVREIN